MGVSCSVHLYWSGSDGEISPIVELARKIGLSCTTITTVERFYPDGHHDHRFSVTVNGTKMGIDQFIGFSKELNLLLRIKDFEVSEPELRPLRVADLGL